MYDETIMFVRKKLSVDKKSSSPWRNKFTITNLKMIKIIIVWLKIITLFKYIVRVKLKY